MRPRPGRGSAAQSTHRELDSPPGSLRDPPGCTGGPVPVPSCSACSGRPVPHLSPDLKHSLTRTSPHLKRTRTPSCAFHSNSTSTRSLTACARKQREGERHGERPDAGWADYPRICAKQRTRLSSTARCTSASAIDLMCARTRLLARPRLTHTGSRARPSGPLVPVARSCTGTAVGAGRSGTGPCRYGGWPAGKPDSGWSRVKARRQQQLCVS